MSPITSRTVTVDHVTNNVRIKRETANCVFIYLEEVKHGDGPVLNEDLRLGQGVQLDLLGIIRVVSVHNVVLLRNLTLLNKHGRNIHIEANDTLRCF